MLPVIAGIDKGTSWVTKGSSLAHTDLALPAAQLTGIAIKKDNRKGRQEETRIYVCSRGRILFCLESG